jgi:hypothetical protein
VDFYYEGRGRLAGLKEGRDFEGVGVMVWHGMGWGA